MQIAYLGFLETLQEIFRVIFEDIFRPVMEEILVLLFQYLGYLINIWWASWLVPVEIAIFRFVDFLSNIFDIFSGAQNIIYKNQSVQMLDVFIGYSPIRTAFLYLSFFAAGLAFLFTIYGVAKSISDMTLDGKNPVGKILGRGLKAAISFLLVPLMCYLIIQLSTLIVVNLSDTISSTTGAKQPTLGSVIFLSGTFNAANNKNYNPSDSFNPSYTDTLRADYYYGNKKYYDLPQVYKDFQAVKFNKLIPLACALIVILILILCIFTFIQRIIEVLVLYLVSPFFISTMPLDDGALFGKWRDMFVAKVLSAFGSVFTMKLFLVIIPLISGSKIILSTNPTINSILGLFIIIGGAWATYKSQTLILQIINPEAAQAIQGNIMLIGGVANMAGRKVAKAADGAMLAATAATGGAAAAPAAAAKAGTTAAKVGSKAAAKTAKTAIKGVGKAAKQTASTAKEAITSGANSDSSNE